MVTDLDAIRERDRNGNEADRSPGHVHQLFMDRRNVLAALDDMKSKRDAIADVMVEHGLTGSMSISPSGEPYWSEPEGCAAIEREARLRAYLTGNLAVWRDDPDPNMVAVAVIDIFQKCLNVLDTGDPIAALATTPEGE